MYKVKALIENDDTDSLESQLEEALNNPPEGYELFKYEIMEETAYKWLCAYVTFKQIQQQVTNKEGRKFKTGE